MKILKTKSEITSKNLKEQNCDFNGFRLGYDKEENLYIIGNHWDFAVSFFETIKDLKLAIS